MKDQSEYLSELDFALQFAHDLKSEHGFIKTRALLLLASEILEAEMCLVLMQALRNSKEETPDKDLESAP